MAISVGYGTLQIPDVFRNLWPEQSAERSEGLNPAAQAVAVLDAPVRPTDETIFLGVGQAATRLGVHENTVRNWIDRGILRAVRLPGSNHRRMNFTDVERVRQEMLGQLSSPGLSAGQDDEGAASSGHDRGMGKQGSPHEGW